MEWETEGETAGAGSPGDAGGRGTPPDSWGRLLGDLKAVEDYGNSPHRDNPTCHYLGTVGEPCDGCRFHGRASCIGEMCADIADRIRKLGGVCTVVHTDGAVPPPGKCIPRGADHG